MVATAIYSVTMVLLLLLLSILPIKYVLLVHCVELTNRLASQGVVVPSSLHYAFINCCLAFIAFVSTTFLSNLTGWDPHFGIGWHSKYDTTDTVSASLSFLRHIFHYFH